VIDCRLVSAGVDNIACISAATDYNIGYVFIILLTAVLYFNLANNFPRERLATTLLVVSIVIMLGTVRNMLFPDHFFIIASVLFLGSLGMLAWRN
jgi:prepilin signal peptidase PulO-like enzyme (type II secretory pathway)